jgi:hypothetical protein
MQKQSKRLGVVMCRRIYYALSKHVAHHLEYNVIFKTFLYQSVKIPTSV